MTQTSPRTFSLKITQGVPNFESIVIEAQKFGCHQCEIVPWTVPLKSEKPRSYIQRILTNNILNVDDICLVYIVTCGYRILPIPESAQHAAPLLKLLSGRRHQIWIGLGFKMRSEVKVRMKLITTRISFKSLTPLEIKDYISNAEGHHCSGGYDPNGYAAPFIKSINGSPSALKGLPAYEFKFMITTWRSQFHG